MKVQVPARETELCDVCHRESFLTTCLFCGGQYCLTCEAIITGCVHSVQLCRKCGENEQALAIVMRHAPLIRAAIKARDTEIARAGQFAPAAPPEPPHD